MREHSPSQGRLWAPGTVLRWVQLPMALLSGWCTVLALRRRAAAPLSRLDFVFMVIALIEGVAIANAAKRGMERSAWLAFTCSLAFGIADQLPGFPVLRHLPSAVASAAACCMFLLCARRGRAGRRGEYGVNRL